MFDKEKFSNIIQNISSYYKNSTEFSETAEVNRTYISKYMNKKLDNPPSPDILRKIADNSKGLTTYIELMIICGYIANDEFGLYKNMNSNNINMVSEESEHYDTNTIKIPVIKTITADKAILAEQNIIDYEELPAKEFKYGEYFGLKIKEDSMSPRILKGDVAIVRQQSDCDNGKIAVVVISGNEATVKQVKKTETGLMLIPYNKKYDPVFFTKEEIETKPVKIIGVVKRLIGYNFE